MKQLTKLPILKMQSAKQSMIEDYTKEVLNNCTAQELQKKLNLAKKQMQEASNEYFDCDYHDEYVDLIQQLINEKN